MIQISEKVPLKDKLSILNEIVDRLDIRACLHTVIGDMFTSGLSGGEKKRASIACELLADPDILLLDEPTSGLDSSTALSLMKQIKQLAVSFNKTVVLSIHQPSSQIYLTIESLLLLARGQVVYFGKAHEEPSDFFQRFGHVCEPHYNPADFYLEILRSDETVLEEIISAHRKTITTEIKGSGNNKLNGACSRNTSGEENVQEKNKWSSNNSIITTRGSTDTIISFFTTQSVSPGPKSKEKWPTSFLTQLKMLTWRSFKQSKGRILHVYNIVNYAILTAIAGALFYQIKQNEDSVRDRMGLLCFILTFWEFQASTLTVFGIPGERGVIAKERAAGAYRLSAYYLAKSASDLPLQILTPTLSYTFTFWMAGLGGVPEFFATLPVLLLATITAQGLGLFLGCAFMDIKMAAITSDAIIMIGLLFSGFVTQTFPVWLTWAKYISILNYPLSAMSIVIFQTVEYIPCNTTSVSTFPQCLRNGTDYVTSEDILRNAGIDIPIYCYVSALFIVCVALRLAAYVALRCHHVAPM